MLIFIAINSQTQQKALPLSGDKERSLTTPQWKLTGGCLEHNTLQLLQLFFNTRPKHVMIVIF